MLFRILWGVCVVAAVIAVAFFFIGIADGSVSSFNIVLWVALLGGLAVVVFGSRALARRGRQLPAVALAAVLAVPTLLFGLMFVVMIVGGVHWQ
jgi:hypothetical protein